MALNLPANYDAEQAVVGSMLRDESLVPKILARVDEADFASEGCKRVFQAARTLFREGKPVDPFALRNLLGGDYSSYLAQLMEITPSATKWAAYADLMHEQAALRTIRGCAEQLTAAITLDDCQAPIQTMAEIFAAGRQIEAWTLEEMLKDFMARQSTKETKQYVSFGFQALDYGTYAEPGDVVMIGGAPSDGKTALALTMAAHMAKTYNVGFFSLETGREKLEDRLVSSGFQIDFSRIKKNDLTEADWTNFAAGMDDMSKRRLTVIRSAGMTADQIASISRARGFEVIFIDYVQLITPTNTRGTSRAEQMAEVSRTLHTFAQTSKTMVVELAQLTRQERGSKRERDMFDLAETSQYEKDADLILLLYRPPEGTHLIESDPDSDLLDSERDRILRVGKNKEGMRVRLPLTFDGAKQTFAVLSTGSGIEVVRSMVRAGKAAKAKRVAGQMSMREIAPDGNEPF